jgi:hypothetical protein
MQIESEKRDSAPQDLATPKVHTPCLPMPGIPGRTSGRKLADRDFSRNIAIKRGIIKALPKALREVAAPVERVLAQVRAVVEHPFQRGHEPVPP